MANKIQVKRGVVANLPSLSVGEPAFTTDTNQFYIGNGTSNIEFAKASDLSDLTKLKGYAEYDISTATTIANDTNVFLTLDKVITAGNMTDLSNGGIIIKESGMYEINALTSFAVNTTGHRKIEIFKNGALFKLISFAPSNNDIVMQIIANCICSVGDIIKIVVYQNSGVSLTNYAINNFSGVQIRKVG